MRPDSLIIAGMRQVDGGKYVRQALSRSKRRRNEALVGANTSSEGGVPQDVKDKCIVHLIEVGYCSDPTTKNVEKHQQHEVLLRCLRDEGWTVHGDSTDVMLIGHGGHVFKPFRQTLEDIGVPSSALTSTMDAIHVQAVKAAHSIVIARRQLENAPHRNKQENHRKR